MPVGRCCYGRFYKAARNFVPLSVVYKKNTKLESQLK
ncbi:hypothetical protein BN8_04756 [Fibrisoma limi BUZ 3]|uniref:Uncharacterized protein n=1 Tax=Fibrisoma limi BUZ 3 TaxID=1185876 RepID=I2GNL7_9BACT|nr:hypothetical protein BN8_04756 [Fibrisoma limi BUZ 3]